MNKKKLVILDSITELDFDEIKEFKIITLDYISKKTLLDKNIPHTNSEDYISKYERNQVFEFILSCNEWYKKIPSSKKLLVENVNLLSLLNQQEFHLKFLEPLIKIFTISNIFKNEKPDEIIISSNLYNYVEQFIDHESIKTIKSNVDIKKDNSNNIEIRFNIFSKPVTLYPSRKTYHMLKNLQENIICTIFNLWYKPNSKTSNLILEFNPDLFSTLFSALKSSKNQTLLINNRRSAIWNWNSIKTLRNNNCKIINPKTFFSVQNDSLKKLQEKYYYELKQFFENNPELENFFSIGPLKFWPILKEQLEEIFVKRLDTYLKYIITTKTILTSININSILSLYEHGETENAFRILNQNKIPTILLQHYFLKYDETHFDSLWKYENESMYGFNSSYLMLWGMMDFNYYKRFGISEEKLIVTGSPKHDNYYPSFTSSSRKNILLAVMPISNVSGLCSTATQIEYEKLLKKIIEILKSINNVKIIIKLHPGDNYSNTLLNNYLRTNFPELLVLQTAPSKKLLESCDVLIHTGPEIYETSTIMLEGMLLGKPVIDISLDDQIKTQTQFENGLIQFSVNSDLSQLPDLITNPSKLNIATPKQLEKYVSYPHEASKKACQFLDSLENKSS